MGGGRWTTQDYATYSCSLGRSVATDGTLDAGLTSQDIFTSRRLDSALDPKNVLRECRDSDEHPASIPVILALDVTGSMGSAAAEVAKKLNKVMTDLYEKVQDVEFMIMGIGDLAYDDAPIQASQFESDIRIAEQLDKIYFEGGGGGNYFESYTAAWHFGLRHTDLDCWKRGKKGIIITMGDEKLNPYLPARGLARSLGDNLEADVDTPTLYEQAKERFSIYHLSVKDRATCYAWYADSIDTSFKRVIGEDHYRVVNLDSIAGTIVDIVKKEAATDAAPAGIFEHGISW